MRIGASPKKGKVKGADVINPGHLQDAATGLLYMQQRYYDSELGVFLSVDPVTAYDNPIGQFHRYRYANNSPYKFTDPDGRLACSDDLGCREQLSELEQRGILAWQQGGAGGSNGSFTEANAQARYNAANFAVQSVRGNVEEMRHKSEDSAAQTFEHVFQPISNRFGVEIGAGIDSSRIGGGFYLFGIQVGHEFRPDGIGYSVLGGLERVMNFEAVRLWYADDASQAVPNQCFR